MMFWGQALGIGYRLAWEEEVPHQHSWVLSLCIPLKQSFEERPGKRFSVFLDSPVTKGAFAKGRSSSLGLQPILQRGGACQIVGTTYPSSSFAPTKLNVSDDLAQDVEIRRPCKFSLWDSVRLEVLRKLHSSGLSHPLANYIRLSLLITFLREDSATSFKISLLPHPTQLMMSRPMDLYLGSFSSTVGFGIFAVVLFGAWIWIYASNVPKLLPFGFSFPQGLHRPRRPPFKQVLFSHFRFRVCFAMAIFLSLFSGVRAPLAPESAAEDARARQRSSIHLAAGRVLRAQTMQNRGRLIEQFQTWLFSEHGISWNDIFGKKPLDPEECFLGW